MAALAGKEREEAVSRLRKLAAKVERQRARAAKAEKEAEKAKAEAKSAEDAKRKKIRSSPLYKAKRVALKRLLCCLGVVCLFVFGG